MRILHIINSLHPNQGGTAECVKQIGSAVSELGHSVEVVVCADKETDFWIKDCPLKVHALGPGVHGLGSGVEKFAYTKRLRPWLRGREGNFDVWIINGMWQYPGLGGSRVAKQLGIPYFLYAHGMLDPWSRRAHPIKYLKKFCYWLVAGKAMLQNAKGVVFTSREESKLARGFFPISNWVPLVIGNGVAEPPKCSDEEVQAFRNDFPVTKGRRTWLFLSRIHPKKGLENLLMVFAQFLNRDNPPCLVIAGDGEPAYVARLKSLAHKLGIEDHVVWTGLLYGAKKWPAFKCAELFILPSHQENFGIAVAEALAMAVPVCTTTAVNIWRELEEEDAGLICEDSQRGLRAALERWTALSPTEKAAFGERARLCFDKNFRIADAARRLVAELRKQLGPSGRTESA